MDVRDLIDSTTPMTFLHIPKCGGTSFTEKLMQTRRRHLLIADWQDLDRAPAADLATYDLISGHFYDFQIDTLGLCGMRITILRDPLERMMSAYAFARSQGAEYGTLDIAQQYACSVDFKEYFYSRFGIAERHVTMYMLGLTREDYADIVPLSALFERSLQTLESYQVLMTHDLDRLAFGDIAMRRNTTPARFKDALDLSEYDMAAMRDVLRWDYRLFHHVAMRPALA